MHTCISPKFNSDEINEYKAYYKGEHVYCLKGQFRMRLMSVGILPRMELIFEWGAVYTFTTAARSSRVTALNNEL